MQINSKTALRKIVSQVYDDFHIVIDTATAKHIRDANKRGSLTWTPQRLTVTSFSRDLTITPHHVRENGVGYSDVEWNNA